jgi:ATP-dependent Clp protease ATP-binding subunit ClpC
MLLGLIRDHKSIAAQVLISLGLNLEQLREEILNLLGAGTCTVAGDATCERELHPSDKTVDVFEAAHTEAQALSASSVEPEHVLLALLSVAEGEAGDILRAAGLTTESVRKRLHE